MQCRVCKNEIVEFLSLGKMPLVNGFLKAGQIAREGKFDLGVGFCHKCFLVQLMRTVPPKQLFRNYIYFSSTSSSFLAHCRDISAYLAKRLRLSSKSLVVELASNDGALLRCFKALGVKTLGIDPAKNIAAAANKNGVETLPEFFSCALARKLHKERGIKADLIFGANVLAHVPKILDFVRGVKIILADDGTAAFEFPYIRGLLEGKFDTIYHEHVFYYSLIALRNLFDAAGLEIYDVKTTSMQGGSLVIFAAHPGRFRISKSVITMTHKERNMGLGRIGTYRNISYRITHLKAGLSSLLNSLKTKGKSVAAYGAPAKGNVLLNYFDVADKLDFIVDKSRAKQGLYTPGAHMKVCSPELIYRKKPDYLLILCWNIVQEVIKEHQAYRDGGGKFIVPIPKIKVL